jgi:hypothetical protein
MGDERRLAAPTWSRLDGIACQRMNPEAETAGEHFGAPLPAAVQLTVTVRGWPKKR